MPPTPKTPKLPPAGSGKISLMNEGELHGPRPPDLGMPAQPENYGSKISFNHSGDEDLKNPRIYVTAVTLEDTPEPDKLIYGEAGGADDIFMLGGGWSEWWYVAPCGAKCVAYLQYIPNEKGTGEWNGRGQQGEFVTLATCEFEAVA